MTVSQLHNAGSHHSVSQQSLSAEAKQRLRDIRLDDLDTLWSFRMSGAGRFWCLKHENIYSLLWWDPNHEVYPVSKRNT